LQRFGDLALQAGVFGQIGQMPEELNNRQGR
jgi:hypothetical protein